LIVAPRVTAQVLPVGEPDPAKVRLRIGPLWVNPTIQLTNLGVDTNVFNAATDESPQQDFTLTAEPRADLWLRMGRTWITGNIGEQIVWYQKFDSERSVNGRYQVGWNVPLNRITFNVDGSFLNTRERPGFEIDKRSQRIEKGVDAAVEVRALSKTYFGVRASRLSVDFDKDALFLDSNLHFELNRVSTTGGLTVRHQLTPLTAVTLDVTRIQDRFEFSPLRDSNSTEIAATVKFDPFALIKGSASVGYRDFQPLQPGLPDYQGGTAAVDLSYTLLGTTRFGFTATREVQYSFDINQPYYLLTGVTGSIAQQVFGPVDVVGRVGADRLAYRDRVGAAIAASNRTDTVRIYGAGVGYHLGTDLRIGVNVDHQRRNSPLLNRQYDGLRYGMSVTYGT
jgi:putative beta-barrel porin BBP2